MKEERKILKNSLKNLVNRFGRENFVSALIQNPEKGTLNETRLEEIKDNHILKKAKLNEGKILGQQKALREGRAVEPIIIRKYDKGYEVVVGRVTYCAALQEKMETIKTIEVQLNDEESSLFMLKEISDRKTLNIYELALICDSLKRDFSYRNKDLADFLDQSPSQVSNLLQLLVLPERVLNDISQRKLSYGHAKAISRLTEDDLDAVLKKIYSEKLSVRQTEDLVKSLKSNNGVLEQEETPKPVIVEEKKPIEINDLTVSLTFKDKKSLAEGLKRINKYIKRKKFVLK